MLTRGERQGLVRCAAWRTVNQQFCAGRQGDESHVGELRFEGNVEFLGGGRGQGQALHGGQIALREQVQAMGLAGCDRDVQGRAPDKIVIERDAYAGRYGSQLKLAVGFDEHHRAEFDRRARHHLQRLLPRFVSGARQLQYAPPFEQLAAQRCRAGLLLIDAERRPRRL